MQRNDFQGTFLRIKYVSRLKQEILIPEIYWTRAGFFYFPRSPSPMAIIQMYIQVLGIISMPIIGFFLAQTVTGSQQAKLPIIAGAIFQSP